MFFARALILLISIILSAASSFAETSATLQRVARASLEDLMEMKIISVSKIPEDYRKASSAIFIITAEDIRRSGVTSIPEALRMAPGVNVARLDANKWAISIRGFNARGANKILVLIDGRSIYDPLFSGTVWEFRDVMLEDVERIEVVRGPGGSTWEANAVNGVINIITKHGRDTQGGLVSAGGGLEEKAFGAVRYGGELSEDTFYRVYSKYYDRDAGHSPDVASDDSRHGQAGFRIDSEISKKHAATLQGTLHEGSYEGPEGLGSTVGVRGGALQGNWDWSHSKNSNLTVNSYVESFDIDNVGIREDRTTAEINIQEEDKLSDWFTLINGFQYRFTSDEVGGSESFFVEPAKRDDSLFGIRSAGHISLLKDTLHLRIGAKLERNDYSEFEFQPDFGVSWEMRPEHVLWGSIARAVRTPARIENDFVVVTPPPASQTFRGNTNLESEELLAYQLGYRTLLAEDLLLNTAVFYHDYADIVVIEGATFTNSGSADSYGAESSLRYHVKEWWEILGTYSYILPNLSTADEMVTPPEVSDFEGNTPSNQFYLRSSFDLGARWEMDAGLRYVDNLTRPAISDYTVADIRVAYRVSETLQLAVIGQNLFDRHAEFSPNSEVEERIFGRVTWTFD